MSGTLHYDETYAVEMYDRIDLHFDGQIFDGKTAKIHSRLGMVRVAFLDYLDARRDGSSKRKSVRVPAADVDLMEQDG